jgi:D-lyxose ketol-isomerase
LSRAKSDAIRPAKATGCARDFGVNSGAKDGNVPTGAVLFVRDHKTDDIWRKPIGPIATLEGDVDLSPLLVSHDCRWRA